MDGSDNSRSSKIPIEATVASDGEPLVLSGGFVPRADGFVLDFAIGEDKYTVDHSKLRTRLCASGLLSYTVEFSDERAESVLETPFGGMNVTVVTESRVVEVNGDGVEIALKYSLEASGEVIDRAVKISARFVKDRQGVN